jgi:hypoxanthine phosphoribosyltransferase
LELYDDTVNKPTDDVKIKQWIHESDIAGKRVLIVDEVDDTRTTLHFCVQEIRLSNPASVGVFVVHNKLKEKKKAGHWDDNTQPTDQVLVEHYWPGANVPNIWLVYPWDAIDIESHTKRARDEPR